MAWAKFDLVVPLQLLALSKKAADFYFFFTFFLKIMKFGLTQSHQIAAATQKIKAKDNIWINL